MKKSSNKIVNRMNIMFFLFLLFSFFLIGKIFYLQNFEIDQNIRNSIEAVKKIEVDSPRGNIYSDNGDLLKRIGFNVFEDVFDLSHLQCEDRYGLTILGLENNKNILCNLEYLIETCHAHQKEIEHNYEMACVNNDLENFFQPTSITIKEACKYIDPSVIARLNVELKATPLIA